MGLFDKPAPPNPTLARIQKLRTGLLAFRFLYYVQAESIVTDFVYDAREAELKKLVEANPELACVAKYSEECPTVTVGSSDPYSYPVEIETLALRLLTEHNRLKSGTPDFEAVEPRIDPAFLEDFC